MRLFFSLLFACVVALAAPVQAASINAWCVGTYQHGTFRGESNFQGMILLDTQTPPHHYIISGPVAFAAGEEMLRAGTFVTPPALNAADWQQVSQLSVTPSQMSWRTYTNVLFTLTRNGTLWTGKSDPSQHIGNHMDRSDFNLVMRCSSDRQAAR